MKWLIGFLVFLFLSFFVLTGFLTVKQSGLKPVVRQKETVSLLVAGDLMLDRYVAQIIKRKGSDYPFSEIQDFLKKNDLVLANLEGPFTDFPPKPLHPDNLIFTFDPKLLPALRNAGFTIFSLANNHILNFGEEGLRQTRSYLQKDGLDFFGDPENRESLSLIKVVKGVKIGFVGWNSLAGTDLEVALGEIRELKQKADYVAVYVHWGNEYQKTFSSSQQEQAHAFLDAGADVIFGSHPHVVQAVETYKEKKIFYSLGNFLFDQTFSAETQNGLVVRTIFGDQGITYELRPIKIENFQIKFSSSSTSR